MSMKKFFIALSVLMALALSVVPSNALIGIDDDVPGFDLVQAFFVVGADTTLDTLVVIQEVGNAPAAGQTANLHWHLFDRRSRHLADVRIPYTRNDVVTVSVRDLINEYVSNPLDEVDLVTTIDGETCFVGYIIWDNEITDGATARMYTNNLIGKMYVHDMPAGRAAMTNLAAREWMPGFVPDRRNRGGAGDPNSLFTPPAPGALFGTWASYLPYTWNWITPNLVAGDPGYDTGTRAAPTAWLPAQGQAGTTVSNGDEIFAEYGAPGGAVFDAGAAIEQFTASAYAASQQRERGYRNYTVYPYGTATPPAAPQVIVIPPAPATPFPVAGYYDWARPGDPAMPAIAAADGFAMYPRFYLYDANAQDFIFFWKSQNFANVIPISGVPPNWRLDLNFFDTAENSYSNYLELPNELNIIDTRAVLPSALMAAYPAAGWISITLPDRFGNMGQEPLPADVFNNIEFLGYNWQYANAGGGAAFNWSGINKVARDVDYRWR